MRTIIVLAMHGSPPKDFPKNELIEYFGLHARLDLMSGPQREALETKFNELDFKLRSWVRTEENDPFFFASQNLAKSLQQETGNQVIVGFNEFCNPTLDDSLNDAISQGANKIIVVTPMMTPGGEHAEIEIPTAIKLAKDKNPEVEMYYAWPFEIAEVAKFLAIQIEKSVGNE